MKSFNSYISLSYSNSRLFDTWYFKKWIIIILLKVVCINFCCDNIFSSSKYPESLVFLKNMKIKLSLCLFLNGISVFHYVYLCLAGSIWNKSHKSRLLVSKENIFQPKETQFLLFLNLQKYISSGFNSEVILRMAKKQFSSHCQIH